MKALENSLRCLVHPAVLLCIGLLVLNDHLFKIIAPSWLTGKLSDFAGLFFFPFLLAICFGIVFHRASSKTTGALAIGVTAIWFTLIKTTALGNAMTTEFVTRWLGMPVQIVLDPTDLIALPVLIPAWRLWNRAESLRPTRLSWIALGVASLAALATSPMPRPPMVGQIRSQNGFIFAQAGGYVAQSKDGGRTWLRTEEPLPVGRYVNTQPLTVCDSPNTTICYRIMPDRIEQSSDGGKTWHVAWDGKARRDYLERRISQICGVYSIAPCSRDSSFGPYDLTFAEPADQEGRHTLVVALGSEGVLVREPEGKWRQYAVLDVQPLKFAAESLNEAFSMIGFETLIWLLASFIILAYIMNSRPGIRGKAVPWLLLAVLGVCPLGWLPLLLWAFGIVDYYALALVLSIGISLLSVAVALDRIDKVTAHENRIPQDDKNPRAAFDTKPNPE